MVKSLLFCVATRCYPLFYLVPNADRRLRCNFVSLARVIVPDAEITIEILDRATCTCVYIRALLFLVAE